jgi:hypothetical protein
MGIPACKFGLGGGRWKFRSEQIDDRDIYQAAQVYAAAALEICNWEKSRLKIVPAESTASFTDSICSERRNFHDRLLRRRVRESGSLFV